MMTNDSNKSYVDYLDINLIYSLIKDNFKLFFIVGSLAFVISVLYSLTLNNIYRSEAILQINNQSQNQASSISSLSGFARGLGLNLSQTADRASYALETMKSKDFFEELYKDDQFLINVFASQEYSHGEEKLYLDKDIYDKGWKSNPASITGTMKPSLLDAHQKFLTNNFSVSRNGETGFITISMKHISPLVARDTLDDLIKQVNQFVMDKEIKETKKSIKFLQDQIAGLNNSDVKRAVSQVLQQQIQLLMISEVTDEYILKIIDSPYVPEIKFEPSRTRIVITFSIFVELILFIFLMIKELNKQRRFEF
ncbi:MAG: hypothetical protein CMD35_01905 [Flavobacteriales bacterium]|nr:hypothetical protein [Flavobacteriales bacterium]